MYLLSHLYIILRLSSQQFSVFRMKCDIMLGG